MASKKRASWSKQKEEFRNQLNGSGSLFDERVDSAFSKERDRMKNVAQKKDEARRQKACTSKNRYSSREEARETIALCALHGTTGLREYRCPYCNGWHLTHKSAE